MIDRRSLEPGHLEQYAKKYGAQREVLERMVRALVLLESLQRLDFRCVFKGGTSLVLAIQPIRRFSVDIDLLAETRLKDADLKALLESAARTGGFKHVEEDRRPGRGVPKQHFRFHYDSVVLPDTPAYVLLDLLYEDNPYHNVLQHPISHEVLLQAGEPVNVWMPSTPELLGDKLAAFAPRTVGVLAAEGNHVSIAKQLFDVEVLFDHVQIAGGNFEPARQTFLAIARSQLAYRGLDAANLPRVYDDIRGAGISLASLGEYDKALYEEMERGVRGLKDHLFTPPKFTMDTAPVAAAKAAYLATLIEKGLPFEPVSPPTDAAQLLKLKSDFLKPAEKRRKGMPHAYAYWMKIDSLLTS